MEEEGDGSIGTENAGWDHTKVEALGRGEDRVVQRVMQGSRKKTAATTRMKPIQGGHNVVKWDAAWDAAWDADVGWVPAWDTDVVAEWVRDADGEPAEESRVAGWVPAGTECPRNGQTGTAVVEWGLTRAAAGGPAADEVALKAMRDKKAHRKNRNNKNNQ